MLHGRSRSQVRAVAAILALLLASACAEPTGPRWVDHLIATPDSAHLVPGGTATFDVRVFDQRRDEITPEWASRVHWSIPSGSTIAKLDTLDSGVSITALGAGTVHIRAELGRGQRDIPVFIRTAELDHIRIEPDALLVSSAGGSPARPGGARKAARVHLFDASGRELSPEPYRISWAVADTTRANVPRIITPPWIARVQGTSRGETRLTAIVNDLSISAVITVIDVPLRPSAPEVTALSSTDLEITWERESGANRGYRLHRSDASGSGFVHIASPGAGSGPLGRLVTSYIDTGLQPATTYFYVLEACGEAGCSERSPEGSGTTDPESGG